MVPRTPSLLAPAILCGGLLSACTAPRAPTAEQASAPAEVGEDWLATVQDRIVASEYQPRPDGPGRLRASNRAQDLIATFDEIGLTLSGRSAERREVRLALRAWGRAGSLVEAAPAVPAAGECLSHAPVDTLGSCIRRVESRRGTLTEWWENRTEGLEQGFTVHQRPAGSGELTFDIVVDGAVVEVDPGGLSASLIAADGNRLAYEGLAAWDSDGLWLPARMERTPEGLRLLIDDREATGTLTVDPLLSSAAWTKDGTLTGAEYSWSVASAGDVNGDGYSDALIGQPDYTGGYSTEGAAWLFLGSSTGLASTHAWRGEGLQAGAGFGTAVSTAGDVNGDGFSDVVVGAPEYTRTATLEGSAFLYHGGPSGLPTPASWSWSPSQGDARLGHSVASAGDLNADGYSDVVVGMPLYDQVATNEGAAVVFYGGPTSLTVPGLIVRGQQATANLGHAVAGAGDANGDGFSDFIVGAPYYDLTLTDEGAAFLFLGAADGATSAVAWSVPGGQADAHLGVSVAGAGDINGDGHADLIVGANTYDDGAIDEGAAFLYLGSADGPSTTPSWSVQADQANAQMGTSVASAGDVNGDGFADVIIGSPLYDNGSTDEGRAWVYYGNPKGMSTTAGWTAEANEPSAQLGYSVASAGDVNGNGFADVLVGSPQRSSGKGRVRAYHGAPSGLSAVEGASYASGQAVSGFGVSLAGAGDVNGDGYGDIIVGADHYDDGEVDEGAVWLYVGSTLGLTEQAAWTSQSDQAGALFGHAVSLSGDYNGDGFADLAAGACGHDSGEADEGQVVVFFGSPEGLSAAPDWTFEGDQAGAWLGCSLASAGDVNGDGYHDLLVGAYGYDGGSEDEGRVMLFFGSEGGPLDEPSWIKEMDQAGEQLGFAVASAGDANGDGYGDVIIGANKYDNGEIDEGAVWQFLGSPSGLELSSAWSREADQAGADFGAALALAGDLNNDGFDDVVVAAPLYDSGQDDEGTVWVYMGSAAGLTGPVSVYQSNQAGAQMGAAIAAAGDVNADGHGDLLIGAPLFDDGEIDEGKVWMYTGHSTGVSTSATWTATSNQEGARLGAALSSGGDVNADGYADVLAAAPLFDTLSVDEGRMWAWFGNSGDRAGVAMGSPAQTRQPGSPSPISPGLISKATDGFDVAMLARGPWGRSRVKVQVEVKPYGDPFNGAGLVTWHTWEDTDIAGIRIQQTITGLERAEAWHWRARVLFSPAQGLPQAWTRWTRSGYTGDRNGGRVFTWGYTFYVDRDGDGHAGTEIQMRTASPPVEYKDAATDCDDHNPAANPDRAEVCDPDDVDENCNGSADDDDTSTLDRVAWFIDNDTDGWGTTLLAWACEAPRGTASRDGDCDDLDLLISPDGTETCDPDDKDEDCDGLSDDDDPSVMGLTAWRRDLDGDGYGTLSLGEACESPPGSAAVGGDCNDADPTISPGEAERCDPSDRDEDCDGLADNDDPSTTDQQPWYADADADHYGAAWLRDACDPLPGSAPLPGDCDDGDPNRSPGLPEVCDPGDVDEDCDALADDADPSTVGRKTWYADADVDGWGAGAPRMTCDAPPGASPRAGDCDDGAAAVNPDAVEVCDPATTDEDCDGRADDLDADAAGRHSWYDDDDADGYGDDVLGWGCAGPPGSAALGHDCDDTRHEVNPGAAELCDPDQRDEDCSGAADDADAGVVDAPWWFADADADGHGAAALARQCQPLPGSSPLGDDCDDADDTVAPGLPEICDAVDNDCDAVADDGLPDADADLVCDDLDPCPVDPEDDSDGDGLCDADDLCLGADTSGDSDHDGLCDDTDFRITAEVSSTTREVNLRVFHAPPGATIYIAMSTNPSRAPTCFMLGGPCVDLRNPSLLAQRTADAIGYTSARASVPPTALSGSGAQFQAVWWVSGGWDSTNVVVRRVP